MESIVETILAEELVKELDERGSEEKQTTVEQPWEPVLPRQMARKQKRKADPCPPTRTRLWRIRQVARTDGPMHLAQQVPEVISAIARRITARRKLRISKRKCNFHFSTFSN